MNIQQFEYVIAVEELRNFGQAADRCNITQSTLSTMIARFEEEIGVTIFDRSTKPVTTTKEGKAVIRQLRIIKKEIGNLQEMVNTLKGEKRGLIKIGVIPTIGPYLLPLFLNNFVQRFPNIHFEISEITTDQIVDQIQKRELDVGIVSIPLNYPDIQEVLLFNEPFLCFDSTQKNSEGACRESDIDFERLWLLEEGHCMRTQVEKICGAHQRKNIKRNLDYKSATISTLTKFIMKSGGMTLLPYLATLDLNQNDLLHLRRFENPVPTRAIGMIFHKHFVKKTMLRHLEKEIREKVKPLLPKGSEEHIVISPL